MSEKWDFTPISYEPNDFKTVNTVPLREWPAVTPIDPKPIPLKPTPLRIVGSLAWINSHLDEFNQAMDAYFDGETIEIVRGEEPKQETWRDREPML